MFYHKKSKPSPRKKQTTIRTVKRCLNGAQNQWKKRKSSTKFP